jgi:hypothetical protein
MTCTALSTELSQLREQRSGQVQLIAGLPDNAGKQVAEEQLARIDADIASTQAELTHCLEKEAQAQNPVPQNIRGAVKRIVCHEASSEVGHDEPYLLIASFDMLATQSRLGVTCPRSCIKVVPPAVGPGDLRSVGSVVGQLSRLLGSRCGAEADRASPRRHLLVACMEMTARVRRHSRGYAPTC